MNLKKTIAFVLSMVMFIGILPAGLFDIKASAADSVAEYTRYTASGTPAIEDGIYILTHDGTSSGTQVSNTTTEIMDITSVPQSGRFGEVTNVSITNNKIQTSRAYELNFKRSGSTGNTYYITNNEGKYLTLDSGSLSFGTSQTTLTVSVDSYGNVSIYRNYYRINHSSNYFSTQTSYSSSISATQRIRLFKYESSTGSNKLTNDGTSAKGAVFIDGITDNEDVSKYTSAGPNNELYLLKNQSVAFEVWASAIPDDVQIGAKAVGGSQPTMTVSYTSGANTFRADTQIRTSTDLYYSINDLLRAKGTSIRWTPVTGSDGNNYYSTGTIVIKNTTDGIISITNLKWTFPSAGIGYYENLENGGAQVVAKEPVMLMSSYSTFSLARTALRMDYADLEIKEEDVTVENSKVSVDEAIVIKVTTSTDVDTLVIRDENGNIITPEAVESFVETIDNKDVKQWQVTLSASEAGTYTYTITGAYENGYESDSEPVVITVTVEKPEEITEPEKFSLFEILVGFVNRIFDFFKNLIALFTGAAK